MSRRGKILIACTIAVVSALIAEMTVRLLHIPEVDFKLADKQLHCLGFGDTHVTLCPNKNISFEHADGFAYRVRTNDTGERITSLGIRPQATTGEVWVAGDSIALGYGISDKDSAAYILQRSVDQEHRVRNLGIDALGPREMLVHWESAREKHGHPLYLFWIFHASDFVDEIREARRANSRMRRLAYFLQFHVSRWSALANLIKYQLEEERLSEDRNTYAPVETQISPDHPAFERFGTLLQWMRKNSSHPVVLFYPELDRSTGLPSRSYFVKTQVRRFVEEQGIPTLDLAGDFYAAGAAGGRSSEDLYLPIDGHPSRGAQKIFARAMREYICETENGCTAQAIVQ